MNLVYHCVAYHKSLVRLAWLDRHCSETRLDIRRSLRKLREIQGNGGPLQVYGCLP